MLSGRNLHLLVFAFKLPMPTRLVLARGGFLLLAGVCVGLLLLMVPINLLTIQLDWVFQATYPVVERIASRSGYAGYMLTIRYIVALVCMLVGTGIAWRKADDHSAWLAGALLVTFPMTFNLGGYSETWAYYPPPWRGLLMSVHNGLAVAGLQATLLFVYLFPDGRLPLRWMRWACGASIAAMVTLAASLLRPQLVNLYSPGMIATAAIFTLGVAGQLYRYRRLSTPVERQQTKWVLIGLALLVTVLLVASALHTITEATAHVGSLMLVLIHLELFSLLVLPVTLAFSITQYRLWDIDRLVRRTLLYAVLTSALAGLYLGSVIVLQSALRAVTGQAQSPVVTVLSTLLIAAAAGPLRTRVQRGIDRRFNRRRYDAARTLGAFSAALRDDADADLDRLNAQLIGVVQDSLEPEKVSLWLRS